MKKNSTNATTRGTSSRLVFAAQVAADAFAIRFGAHVTARATGPDSLKSAGDRLAPKGTATLEEAIDAFAAAMCADYGVPPEELFVRVSYADDRSFVGALMCPIGDAAAVRPTMPRIVVRAGAGK